MEVAVDVADSVGQLQWTQEDPLPQGKCELVVEVAGLNGQTWLDRAGNFASAQLRVVERFTPVGSNHIRYEATLKDPSVYSSPWTISMPLYRRVEPNARLLEFKCVPFAEEMMYGHLRKPGTGPNVGGDGDE